MLSIVEAKNNVLNLLNQNSFIFSVDHNAIFGHKHGIDPGNLLNIYCSMLKFQYLTLIVLKFKEVL